MENICDKVSSAQPSSSKIIFATVDDTSLWMSRGGSANSAASSAPYHVGSPSARAFTPRRNRGTNEVEICKPRELDISSVNLTIRRITPTGLGAPRSPCKSSLSSHTRTWRCVAGIDKSLEFPNMDSEVSRSQGEDDGRLATVKTRERAVRKDVIHNTITLDVMGWTSEATEMFCSEQTLPPPPPARTTMSRSDRGAPGQNDAPVQKYIRYDDFAHPHQSRSVGQILFKVAEEKPGMGEGNTNKDIKSNRRPHGSDERIFGVDAAWGCESSTIRAGSCTAKLFEELLDPGVTSIYSR